MKLLVTLLLALVCLPALSQAEIRKFTDTTGREIEAELVAVRGDQVQMKVGGNEFTLPVSKFSEADVTFIREWAVANPAPVNIRGVYIEFEKNMERIKEPKMEDDDKKKKGGSEQSRTSFDYSIMVRNTSAQDLEDLKLKYTIYKYVRDRPASGSAIESLEETEGEEAIGLLAKASDHEVATQAVVATDSETSGKKDEPGSSHSETIWGVVARLYSGETEVRVDSFPDGLADRVEGHAMSDDSASESPEEKEEL